MQEYLPLVIYFFVGVVLDVLLTLNWRYVAKDQALPAAVFSLVVTIASMAVFYSITRELDPTQGITNIVAYSLGVGAGTYLGVKMPIGKKARKKDSENDN